MSDQQPYPLGTIAPNDKKRIVLEFSKDDAGVLDVVIDSDGLNEDPELIAVWLTDITNKFIQGLKIN